MGLVDRLLAETDPETIRRETEAAYRDHLNPMALRMLKSAGLDIIEARREGPWVWDVSGERFLDCVTGAGIFNVGRRNPRVVEVLKQALDQADMGSWIGVCRERAVLARELARIAPGDLSYSIFCCGGGEAVEAAIKLARAHTDRSEIICMENGYHGVTGFALPAVGREVYKKPFRPLIPGYRAIPFNDLEAAAEALGENTAAIVLEPVQGEGGVIPADDEYLRGLRRLCDDRGALLIYDEVQTGLGRTGKMFAAEHSGAAPDIMVLAKALSGGLYPISCAMFTPDISDFLMTNPFVIINSFGGTSLACLAALAALEYTLEHDLPAHAAAMGRLFMSGLEELRARYPDLVVDVRGRGLMLGIELAEESFGPRIACRLRENGVISIYTFNNPRIIRIMPTLVIQAEEVEFVVEAFDRSLAEIRNQETNFGRKA